MIRWTFLSALLLAEIIGLTIAFDAGTRSNDSSWAGIVAFWSPRLLRPAIVGALVFAVLIVWRLGPELGARHSRHAIAAWTTAHVAAATLFALITKEVFDANTDSTSSLTLAAWISTGALAFGFWSAAMVPPRLWPMLLRRGWDILLLAAIAGLFAGAIGSILQAGWDVLSEPTLLASHALLQLFSDDAICNPEHRLLGTSRFWVIVAPACSGYEGMALVLAYLGGYLWLARRDLRFPQALLLLPLGMTAIWLANVVRIVSLILVGHHVSPSLALGGFHSQAGWLLFNAVALSFALLAHRVHLFARSRKPSAAASNATAAYLGPLLAALAIQMLAEALLTDPAILYPLRVAVVALILWILRREHPWSSARQPASSALYAFTVGAAVFLVYVAIDRATATAESSVWPVFLENGSTWILSTWAIIRIIGFVVVTPMAEELAFRGYLMRRLVAADFQRVAFSRFTWPSFLVSSIWFGLVHGSWLAGSLAGMGYALVAYRTNRFWPVVMAHAVTNGLLLIAGFTDLQSG
jgi:exosortase E/protease (VPEID-CTERM system)